MAKEWFRDPAWDEPAQLEFERRLARARPGGRPQYMRIKGLALASVGNRIAATEMFERVLKEYSDSLDAAPSLEHLADLAKQSGDAVAAEGHLRALIERWPTLNATTGMAHVALAEILLDHGGTANANEALGLLKTAMDRRLATLGSQLFRWHVTLVRAAVAIGDRETVQRASRTALSLVGRPPQFSRHPTVGRVEPDQQLIAWLRERSGN